MPACFSDRRRLGRVAPAPQTADIQKSVEKFHHKATARIAEYLEHVWIIALWAEFDKIGFGIGVFRMLLKSIMMN